MRFDQANVKGGGDSVPATGVEPSTITKLFQPEFSAGDLQTLASLRDDQMLADTNYAKDHGFKVGDTIDVTTPTGQDDPVRARRPLRQPGRARSGSSW